MITTTQSAIRSVVEQFVREELSHDDAQIAGAVWAMLDAGGKELRPRITLLASRATSSEAPPDPILASYMELIHIATLIHDDVVDNARLRRGRDSTNSIHGNQFSVLAGDYLFSWVFKKITQGYDSPVPTILASMLSEICNGEVKQLRATANLNLTREEYFEIIGKKTAELFASCAEVGSIAAINRTTGMSGTHLREYPFVRSLRAYGWAFGMAFQVRDDLLDVVASEAAMGKPASSDLRERKVTLPLIAALESGDLNVREQANRFFGRGKDADGEASLGALIAGLRASSALAQTKRVVAAFALQAERALDVLPPTEARAELQALTRTLSEYSS
jgi:octaprenyl-diphosphate synthase